MKVATAYYNGSEELVWVSDNGPIKISQMAQLHGFDEGAWTADRMFREGDQAFDNIQRWVDWAKRESLEPDTTPTSWMAPIPYPGKIICVGLNYRPHAAESALDVPQSPVLFSKFQNAVVGTEATVSAPPDSHQLDYKAELVMVMGRRCVQVSESDALSYVFGYCNGNDLSARDLQFRTSQWLLGKSGDGFGAMGPYMVTADEIEDPDQLEIIGTRNGVEVQHSNTCEMIFSSRYLISYISHYMTLEPGDVIFTGTPEGVILGQKPEVRKWLVPGERVGVMVEGLGELVTYIGEPSDD